MPISKDEGLRKLMHYLSTHWYFSIPEQDLEQILPQVPRPSVDEMEKSITILLEGEALSSAMNFKLEAMDTNEFLDHFCKTYGFYWSKDYINKSIHFKWLGKKLKR
jgi:hypothetical protein